MKVVSKPLRGRVDKEADDEEVDDDEVDGEEVQAQCSQEEEKRKADTEEVQSSV